MMNTESGGEPTSWATARSLDDLGEMTARWLGGATDVHPAYMAPGPDAETGALIPTLCRWNRAGLVTDFSQPGQPLAAGGGQRAAVSGWCTPGTVELISVAVTGTDLVAMPYEPNIDHWTRIPISLDAGEPYTWVGGTKPRGDVIGWFAGHCPPAALVELADAWEIIVFDPVWGRNDLLWTVVDAALRRGLQAGT